jgi:hypothetical protein
MNPLGIVAVAALMITFVFYRWWTLSRTGEYDARTEWPFWLFAAGAIVVSIVVTLAGRLAMLILGPILLIPAGVFLLKKSDAVRTVGGPDLRSGGWLAIFMGVLTGLAALAELWFTP